LKVYACGSFGLFLVHLLYGNSEHGGSKTVFSVMNFTWIKNSILSIDQSKFSANTAIFLSQKVQMVSSFPICFAFLCSSDVKHLIFLHDELEHTKTGYKCFPRGFFHGAFV